MDDLGMFVYALVNVYITNHFLMGKSTISMAMFNSHVSCMLVYQSVNGFTWFNSLTHLNLALYDMFFNTKIDSIWT